MEKKNSFYWFRTSDINTCCKLPCR